MYKIINVSRGFVLSIVAGYVRSRWYGTAITSSVMTTILFYISLWAVYSSFIYPYYVSPLRHLPTVPGCPLWGHVFQKFAPEYGLLERQWHLQHGPIVRSFFPFGSERISITDDEAIQQIIMTDVYLWNKPASIQSWMASVLGRGVLLVDGEEHRRQRKALAPAFSIASIQNLAPLFWQKGILLASLIGQITQGSPSASVEMLDWLNRATLDVIGAAAFGHEIHSMEDPNVPLRQAYASVFAWDFWSCLVHFLRGMSDLARYLPFKANYNMSRARLVIMDTANAIVSSKQDQVQSSNAKDIISLIVKRNDAKDTAPEDVLSFEAIRDQVMTFLGAGHDTTASAVCWTLDLLSKHQDIQHRLREEIHRALPLLSRASPDTADNFTNSMTLIDQLPYLGNVCRESLRYIPPIPVTSRDALIDTVVAGVPIPAGTRVMICANATNHMPTYWGNDAHLFNPDRWDQLPSTVTRNANLTFLHGPRSCIGRKFAETEMKVFLCCLLARFQFDVDPGFPDQESCKMWRLVLRPRDGINLMVSAAP